MQPLFKYVLLCLRVSYIIKLRIKLIELLFKCLLEVFNGVKV
jgi:hypothetical protein